jgi:hypothetical protein
MPRQRHLAYVAIWSAIFVAMSVTGILDDRHPGQWVPFWQKACAADAPNACNNLAFLEEGFCLDGSGWACNEFAILQADRLGRDSSVAALQRGCALRFDPACENLARVTVQPPTARGAPRLEDYPIILRGSKGPVTERDPVELYALACEQGWPDTCGGNRVSREE